MSAEQLSTNGHNDKRRNESMNPRHPSPAPKLTRSRDVTDRVFEDFVGRLFGRLERRQLLLVLLAVEVRLRHLRTRHRHVAEDAAKLSVFPARGVGVDHPLDQTTLPSNKRHFRNHSNVTHDSLRAQ